MAPFGGRSRRPGTGRFAPDSSRAGDAHGESRPQGDQYVARFRFQGKEFKKSLKTTRKADAQAGLLGIERAIHALTTGLVEVSAGVDPGDFIVSGGTAKSSPKPHRRSRTLADLAAEYLLNQAHKAPASIYTEKVHLGKLAKKLGDRAQAQADRITRRDLEHYLQARL